MTRTGSRSWKPSLASERGTATAELRVVESKTEEGERLITLPHSLATELEKHYAGSAYRADTDYVFAHPERGTRLCADWFRLEFKAARKTAGVEGRIRLPTSVMPR